MRENFDVDDESTKRNFVETGVARKESKTLNLILGSLVVLSVLVCCPTTF